jgi:hypothetical protein
VKSDETVSRFVQEPILLPRVTETPTDVAKQEAPAPKPPPVGTESQKEEVPATGAGKRVVWKINFDAVLPGSAIAEKHTGPIAVPPSVMVVGTGRKEVRGIDFSAANPETTGRMNLHAIVASRSGRRNIRGVTYAASPGRKTVPERGREGAGTRNVTGVDIKATPP